MASPITNTLPTSPFAGLFTPPKTNYGGLFNAPQTTPTTSYTAKPLFPSTQIPTSVVKPLAATPATSSTTSVNTSTIPPVVPQNTSSGNTTPIVGGANSGGTVNPNYNLQTGSNAPASTLAPVKGLFSDVATSLAGSGAANTALGNRASDISKFYEGQIQGVLPTLNQVPGLLSTGSTPVAEGNAQAAYNAGTSRIAGLTAAENAALTGNAQGLTAQAQTQSALSAAGQLAQPSGSYPFVFDPTTGQFTSSGNAGGTSGSVGFTGNYSQDLSTITQEIMKNPSLYNTLSAGLSSFYGSTALGNLNQAITQAGGNPTTIQAQSGAAATNVTTAGTAQTGAANTAYNAAVQKVAANTATYSALTGVSNNLNETLANWKQSGILTDLNKAINNVASRISNPDYQKFVAALGNAQASYQAALGASGVTPTKADQDAVAALNPNSSATAINAALNQLSADAHALLIVPAYQQQQTYGAQLGIQ